MPFQKRLDFVRPRSKPRFCNEVIGMKAFRLPNGGNSWLGPQELIVGRELNSQDDKPWIACDRSGFENWNNSPWQPANPSSPWKGYVYIAWGVGGSLNFARSTDGGLTWVGAGNLDPGANVPGTSSAWAPEVTVDDNGIVHVVWHYPGTPTIMYTRSTDGGETFEPQKTRENSVGQFPQAGESG
jgi:hypothetical protein